MNNSLSLSLSLSKIYIYIYIYYIYIIQILFSHSWTLSGPQKHIKLY